MEFKEEYFDRYNLSDYRIDQREFENVSELYSALKRLTISKR